MKEKRGRENAKEKEKEKEEEKVQKIEKAVVKKLFFK